MNKLSSALIPAAFILFTSTPSYAEVSYTQGVAIGLDGETGSIPAILRVSDQRVFIGLEANLNIPYGIGSNLLFYIYNSDLFSIHFIDPGIFYSWGNEISAPEIKRAFDISFGAGIEINLTTWLALTLDWRAYIPEPFRTIPNYADYGIRGIKEALRGQIWLGVQLIFI